MKLSCIMVHYGDTAVTIGAYLSLIKSNPALHVIIVNNSPEDLSNYPEFKAAELVNSNNNRGYGSAVNLGLAQAMADPSVDLFLVLNNDLKLESGQLARVTRVFLDKKSAGIVAPVLKHRDYYDWGGKLNKWLAIVKHSNFEQKPKTVLSVSHVAGAAIVLSRKLIDRIGLFDERFFMYYEDIDYSLRALDAGFTIHICPDVVFVHQISGSTSRWQRTLYNWRSHIQFVVKYMGKRVYLTAFITDLLFYPFLAIRSLLHAR